MLTTQSGGEMAEGSTLQTEWGRGRMEFRPKGVVAALVTPFTDRDEVNEEALRQLVDHLVVNGVHGVFGVGSQGEFYALTKKEKQKVMEVVQEAAKGRVPVYMGIGAVTTREVIELNEIATGIGVDAVSIMTPYFIRPSQDELYEHYMSIARRSKLPILLYNNCGRTGVNISASLAARLAGADIIVGIKDSSGDFTLTSEYIRATNGKHFGVMAGRDTLILSTLLYGGCGAVAASANVAPRLAASIYDSFVRGDIQNALESQRTLSLVRNAFELGTFPVVIKESLRMIGIDAGSCRKPVGNLGEKQRSELAGILRIVGVMS